MENDNLSNPINRLVEFGMSIAMAQQMVNVMNKANEGVKVPGKFQDFQARFLSRICRICSTINSVESRFCSKCGEKLLLENARVKICYCCNTTNETSSKFCIQCGAILETTVCISCYTENNSSSKFCKNCGKSLIK